MPGSKPGALPLGDTPTATLCFYLKKLVSPEGFEPATHGLEGRCSIQLSYEPTFSMERVMRIELTLSAWKAEVLPLNYTRVIKEALRFLFLFGAEDEIRTRDPRLGKAMLYP